MALQAILESLEGINEAFHPEYRKAEDGKFYLIVEGLEDVAGLKANNAKLLDEKRKLQEKYKQFEGIDPAKAQEALAKLQKLEEQRLLDDGQVEEVIAKRTQLMKQNHENQINQYIETTKQKDEENAKLRSALNTAVIERGVIDAVNAVGQPKKEALEDIIARGKRIWQLNEDGQPVPLNPDGTVVYGKDASKAMTMSEWAANLLEVAPHLWLDSKGGGARGSVVIAGGRSLSSEELSRLSPTEKAKAARGLAPKS